MLASWMVRKWLSLHRPLGLKPSLLRVGCWPQAPLLLGRAVLVLCVGGMVSLYLAQGTEEPPAICCSTWEIRVSAEMCVFVWRSGVGRLGPGSSAGANSCQLGAWC